MRNAIVVVALVTLASACAKQQKPVVAPTPTGGHPFLLPTKSLSEKDIEDMQFALLELRRVHFALDSTHLTKASRSALQEAKIRLEEFPEVHLYVEGHADSYGSTEYNISLAEDRATVVCDYLSRLGMDPQNLHVVSWGEEKPLAEGTTPQVMAMNRRVEFVLKHGDLELHLEEGTIVAER